MAEEAKSAPAAAPAAPAAQDKPQPAKSSMTGIIIIAVAAVVCLAGGFAAAKFMKGPKSAQAAPAEHEDKEPAHAAPKKESGGHGGGGGGHGSSKKESAPQTASDGSWQFELDPVIANLDEPGITRYVRASLILEMSPDISDAKGEPLLTENKAMLRNWLTIYLAGCTLDDIRGRKNLVRIQSEIKDAYNDIVFKKSKPMIKAVLFKEFQIQ